MCGHAEIRVEVGNNRDVASTKGTSTSASTSTQVTSTSTSTST